MTVIILEVSILLTHEEYCPSGIHLWIGEDVKKKISKYRNVGKASRIFFIITNLLYYLKIVIQEK